jgi:NTE family protein
MIKEKKERPKVGLALGSGGARGLSIIGVLKVLEKNNIPIDFIAGSSVGAVIGGLYATGCKIEQIEKIFLDLNFKSLFSLIDLKFGNEGLIGGDKIKKIIDDYINVRDFSDCKIPFSAVATDLNTGAAVILNKGMIAISIRASMSIPVVFKAVEIDGMMLADGGLSLPVPVSVARDMGADIVIAVNLDEFGAKNNKNNIYKIAENSLSILRKNLAICNTGQSDICITPDVQDIYWDDFIKGKRLIQVGEEATEKLLPKIKEIIE